MHFCIKSLTVKATPPLIDLTLLLLRNYTCTEEFTEDAITVFWHRIRQTLGLVGFFQTSMAKDAPERSILQLASVGNGEYAPDMVSDRDKAIITALARRYGAARVWLFGSNANPRKRGRDIDLAVEGVAPARFFEFVGDLMLSLSQPVDVLDLRKRSKMSALIRREGIPICVYGEPAGEG